jgi:Ca2+-transporting ATPase
MHPSRVNMVFSDTAATGGRGRAVVTATEMATEMDASPACWRETEEVPTPLQREIALVGGRSASTSASSPQSFLPPC